MTDDIENTLAVRVYQWGIRRRDGGITMSSEGWARDVHEMVGLPLLRFNGIEWVEQ